MTASEAMTMNLAGEGQRDPSVPLVASEAAESISEVPSLQDADGAMEVDVEEIPLEIPPAAPTGFQAFLQHANLHNLLQIEGLSRTTGVFLVVSQGRRGYLHLSNGDLIHAETGLLTGEAAASEILAWGDGEFKSCVRPLAPAATILSSLQALLLRLAKDTDEAAQSQRSLTLSVPRPTPAVEEDKPTEPHLPAPSSERRTSSAPPPRSSRLPPPLPPRIEREASNVSDVLISPTGELVQGRGVGPDEFSARVAYAARLADLIGRAIRSGTPRALELRGKGTQTNVKWQADGSLAASLELVQSPKIR
jgi:hypothetical protein